MVDESAFAEIEKSNVSPSLFTKIFLEKEIYTNEENEFRNSHNFIDHIFNSG